MAILKRPKRANDDLRPKMGVVASVLAQSKVVSDAFGRGAGFVLMMMALLMVLLASVAIVIVVGKGTGLVMACVSKFLL